MHPRNKYYKNPADFGKLGEKYPEFRKYLLATSSGPDCRVGHSRTRFYISWQILRTWVLKKFFWRPPPPPPPPPDAMVLAVSEASPPPGRPPFWILSWGWMPLKHALAGRLLARVLKEGVQFWHNYTQLKTHRLFQVDIDRREQCCVANYEQVVNHVVPSCYSWTML
jgi:hypothetical protein